MNKPANQPNQSANAKHTGPPEDAGTGYGQRSEHMTTSQGAPVRDTDHSLKAGPRGPVLLQDHHLREKITHFDHERIPERVVHARGAGAFGQFTSYGTAESICAAGSWNPDASPGCFPASPPWSVRAAPRTPCATPAGSPRSSTPRRGSLT